MDTELVQYLTQMEGRIGKSIQIVRDDVAELGKKIALAVAHQRVVDGVVDSHHKVLHGEDGNPGSGLIVRTDRLAENQGRNRRAFYGVYVPTLVAVLGAVAGLIWKAVTG